MRYPIAPVTRGRTPTGEPRNGSVPRAALPESCDGPNRSLGRWDYRAATLGSAR